MVLVIVVAFLFGFFGSMPMAGPVSIMTISRAAEKKYDAALRLAFGAAVAEAVYAGVAFWGFATFLARHPIIIPISHASTALILGGLGVKFCRYTVSTNPKRRKEEEWFGKAGPFYLGLGVTAINPTLLGTWSAVAAILNARQLVDMTPVRAIPFGIAGALGDTAWLALVVAVMKKFGDRFPTKILSWMIRAMGVLLIVLAVISAVDFVKWLRHH